jgi:acyl carrier protein
VRPEHEKAIRSYLKSRFRGYRDDTSVDDSLKGIVDSIGQFEMVEFLETKFGFRIPNEEFHPDRFATIGRIGDMIEQFVKL